MNILMFFQMDNQLTVDTNVTRDHIIGVHDSLYIIHDIG